MFTGGVHCPGARSGRQSSEPREHAASPQSSSDRSRKANPRSASSFVAGAGGSLRDSPASDNGPAHLLHRGPQGDRQRRVPPSRRHAFD